MPRHASNSLSRAVVRAALSILLLAGLSSATSHAQDPAFVKIGRFWTIVTPDGAQAEANLTSGWFPNDFNAVGNSGGSGSAVSGGNLDLMVRNWTDPEGNVIPKVINTSVSTLNPDGTVVEPMTSYLRYPLPKVTVNTNDVSQSSLGDVDPGAMIGSSEQVVHSTYEYAIGIQADRKVLAWSQQNHDDYLVIDVTFTNVGNQTLEDLVIALEIAPMDFARANGDNPQPSGLGQDNYSWFHYYGALPSDSQRVSYGYHADDAQTSGDNMGNPALDQEGRLIVPGSQFLTFLHTSREAYTDPANDVDDPLQPRTTFVAKGGLLGIGENNREKLGLEATGEWFDAMRGSISALNPMPGAPQGTHHEINNDETGSPDFQAFSSYLTYAGFVGGIHNGIGPYTMAPGESVRLIYAVGHAGLSLRAAKEIGRKMMNGTLEPPPGLPDPETGYFPENFVFPSGATEMDVTKDLWLSTVIDSVHEAAYRARWNYEHDWNVPAAPPPPASVDVKGFADEARITWTSGGAEDLPNFAGYRVMRRRGALDTTFFEVIHQTPPEEKAEEYTFNDTKVQFGASYYYYVQSAVRVPEEEANALPAQRGRLLWSGRAYVPTPEPIEPPRGGTETLDDIVVAPNPYNINDPSVAAQGWTDFRGIVFFNLPDVVEIDVYTEDGDHIKHLVHDSPVGAGSLRWDMLTDSQQVISSGVYIATFTDQEGAVAYRKFIVVR